MSLCATTNSVLNFLYQRDNISFITKDLIENLSISSARISDILNVFTAINLIHKSQRIYYWKRCDIKQKFLQYVNLVDSPGSSQCIIEHTRTVIFGLKNKLVVDKSRRTYDVISVLSALELIQKQQKTWILCQSNISSQQIFKTQSITPLCEFDTDIIDLPLLEFSFDQ